MGGEETRGQEGKRERVVEKRMRGEWEEGEGEEEEERRRGEWRRERGGIKLGGGEVDFLLCDIFWNVLHVS